MGTQLTAHADANSEARMLRSLPRRNLLAYFPVAGQPVVKIRASGAFRLLQYILNSITPAFQTISLKNSLRIVFNTSTVFSH